mmetsp:Transcript_67725/g.180323  ORF Transcript_67725/g.180323 Transcript_67725/m.180323 type:complete len:83 (-) Transcript_67725:10-258(-)
MEDSGGCSLSHYYGGLSASASRQQRFFVAGHHVAGDLAVDTSWDPSRFPLAVDNRPPRCPRRSCGNGAWNVSAEFGMGGSES